MGPVPSVLPPGGVKQVVLVKLKIQAQGSHYEMSQNQDATTWVTLEDTELSDIGLCDPHT